MNTTLIIIAILIYLLSAYGIYKITQISYSRYGRWEILNPDMINIIFMVTPYMNTMTTFVWLGWKYHKRYRIHSLLEDPFFLKGKLSSATYLDKFFRIKN